MAAKLHAMSRPDSRGRIMALGNLLVAACLAVLAAGPARSQEQMLVPVADAFASEAQAALKQMDDRLSEAARRLAQEGGPAGQGARDVLRALFRACPLAVDVCTVDLAGRMVAVEPESYRRWEGADISGQEQIGRLWRTRRPVMSQVLRTVEGIDAVDLEHPIMAGGDVMLGSVSVLFRPETVLAAAWNRVGSNQGLEPWAIDHAGRLVHDPDPSRIGRLLLDEGFRKDFPELGAVARRMAAEARGKGGYSLPASGGRPVMAKHCAWATVELHGVWWRLAVSRPTH